MKGQDLEVLKTILKQIQDNADKIEGIVFIWIQERPSWPPYIKAPEEAKPSSIELRTVHTHTRMIETMIEKSKVFWG